MEFWRGIDENAFELAKPFWESKFGQEIVNCDFNGNKQFQICIRNNYFNVYWRGCSVLKFNPMARKHIYTIHHKYIPIEQKNTYVDLNFDDDDLKSIENGWSFREKIIEPARKGNIPNVDKYAGNEESEKTCLASYLDSKKPCWLDLEIAFSRIKEIDEIKKRETVADRIDLAVIEIEGETPTLKFVEVKLASDSRLRAKEEPEIFRQMTRYKAFIDEQTKKEGEKAGLLKSYKTVAKNMLDLSFIHDDSELVRSFINNGEIDTHPYLLIIGDLSTLKNGKHGDHWEKLGSWAERENYPQPLFHPKQDQPT